MSHRIQLYDYAGKVETLASVSVMCPLSSRQLKKQKNLQIK